VMQKDSRAGTRVEKIMVVAKKSWRESVNGKFLLFQFSDKEGQLKGVLWQVPEWVDRDICVNDVVRVQGELKDYQGNIELHIEKIERLESGEYDQTLFLPASSRSLESMYNELLNVISEVSNSHIRRLLETIFRSDAFRKDFSTSPAAKSWHHSYIGGLLEHTYDMLKLALRAADVYPEIDRDLLVAGVLLHDIGKIQEFSVTNNIEYSDKGRLEGHIALGVEFVGEYMRGIEDFPEELELRIKHMILSHHGSLENGSPVVPMTVEAMVLHYIDNLDAQVRGALQILSKQSGDRDRWTEYVRLLNRYIYRGDNNSEGNNGQAGV